jgi:hypothetical protein
MAISNPNQSREMFDSLKTTLDQSGVDALIKRLRSANAKVFAYHHRMFIDDPELAKQICYFVHENPSKRSAEVRWADFGILDLESLGCQDAENRDISEFRLIAVPTGLPVVGLPMMGWGSQAVKAFRHNDADPDVQFEKGKLGLRNRWQEGLTSYEAFEAGLPYSQVIYRVNAS